MGATHSTRSTIFRTRSAALAALPGLLLALTACETTSNSPPYEANASMGMLIARDSCSECHAVTRVGDSPNENAPAFNEVINRPGMTSDAIAAWLRDAHNYPIEMGVHLEPHQADSLVAYMQRMQAESSAN